MKTIFKTILATVLVIISGACAKPTYLTAPASGTTAEKAESSACTARFQTSGACLTIRWEKFPTESDFGSFIMTTSQRDSWRETNVDLDLAADGATLPVTVTPWMPSMGHGVPRKIVIEKLGPGLYRASKVFFTMKHDWELRFQIGDDQAVYSFFIE